MILIRVGTVEQKEEVLARPPQSVGIEIFHFLEFLEFTIKMLKNIISKMKVPLELPPPPP